MTESSFESWVKNLSHDEKSELIKKIEEDATAAETEFYGCARSVVHAFQVNMNLGSAETFKASLGMSGGAARNCEVCGALLGGLMMVGLVYGTEKLAFPFGSYVKEKEGDDEVAKRYADVMGRAGRICDRFREVFGGLRCSDAQRATRDGRFWDLKDPEQLAEYLQPVIHDKCGFVAGTAARFAAEEILNEQ